MSEPLIVYVDTMSLERAGSVVSGARRRGIGTAVVCPPGLWNGGAPEVARVVETSDFSVDGMRRSVDTLARDHEILGIHSSFGAFRPEGFVHEAVSVVATERGLPHNPVAALYRATNKYLARQALSEAGVPNVRYALASDAESLLEAARELGYPLVLKPLTGVGSSLILRCDDDREALEALALALGLLPRAYYGQLSMAPHHFLGRDGGRTDFDPVRTVLVEQYVAGREASVECLVGDGEVVPLVVHDKLLVEEAASVVYEHLLVAPPERFSDAEVAAMCDYAVRVVEAIGLRNLLCHVELRYDDDAGPLLLEINPRIGAGCVRDSLETFTDLDVEAAEVALILGEEVRRPRPVPSASRHALAFLFSPATGVLEELSGLRRALRLPEVEVVRVSHRAGDRVGGDHEEVFLASIWMQAADGRAALESYERIKSLVRIRVR